MRALMVVVGLLALSACGARPAEPDEDVPATWTAGDDAPLEESGD